MNLPNTIDISFRLKEIRRTLGKSRSEFADILLISKSHLANIENGNRDVTVELLFSLRSIFNVSANYLLYGVGSMFVEEESGNVNIYGLNNSAKLELLLRLYHYFVRTKEIVINEDDKDLLEYLREADSEIWMEYAKRIDGRVKIVEKPDR